MWVLYILLFVAGWFGLVRLLDVQLRRDDAARHLLRVAATPPPSRTPPVRRTHPRRGRSAASETLQVAGT